MKPINIHTKDITIPLECRNYKINVLGGYGVKLGDFGVSIKHEKSNELINATRNKSPVQSRAYNRRSKRILIIDVHEQGNYQIIFHNPETLSVKKSNLFIHSMYKNPIDNSKFEVHFI